MIDILEIAGNRLKVARLAWRDALGADDPLVGSRIFFPEQIVYNEARDDFCAAHRLARDLMAAAKKK